MKPIDQVSIRQQNLLRLWEALLHRDAATRQELAEQTGLSLMSVTNLIDQLDQHHALRIMPTTRTADAARRTVGRKADRISVNTDHSLWLVLDLTDVHFRCWALRLDLSIRHAEPAYAYDERLAYAENLTTFLRQTRRHLEDALGAQGWLGIAVAVPGPYNVTQDTVHNKRIPALNALRIKETLRQAFGACEYYVDEDVKLAIRAYLPHAVQAQVDVLYYLYIGEGVGGAATYHGHVVRGLNAVAGDAGQLLRAGGESFESTVSLRAFAARLGLCGTATLDEDALLARMHAHALAAPEAYRAALDEVATAVGETLHDVLWMFDPEQIIIDCRYALPLQQAFLAHVEAALRARVGTALPRIPPLVPAQYEMRSMLYGAVQALSEEWLHRMAAV